MLLIRRFEEATIELHGAGEVPGPIHLSIGQEAAIVGACMATETTDFMTGTHRSHGHPIAKGAPVDKLMAEILGKATGICGGKGGSMHLADFSVGSLGESGIVASALPVATGAALAASLQPEQRVVLCFFGDGAANEGVFHESLNLASLWKLPVIYFCENNEFAVTTPHTGASSLADIALRAASYAMPGEVVDGQDVLQCHATTAAAVARARAGEGPTLIEAKTLRFTEHAFGLKLNAPYRSEDALAEARRTRDPLAIHRNRLQTLESVTEDLAAIEEAVDATVSQAVTFARESPYPPPDAAISDLYV
jgi:pyruvate dehydrogenase E1 component alpha subunit